jgi:hypothetical protein
MRKRKKLEVSTFPFLAVLLCTMGALILLLLVMDKKAKKAALEKAYEAAWAQSKNLQAKTDADKQNLESEKNAWIKLKSEQHEELLKKEATLEKEIALLKIELSNLDKNYEKSKSETSSDDLLKKEIALTNEKSKVHILAKKLELEKANADKNLKETKDLAEKISSMEQILKKMKSSLDKDKFAYSIVPYFGKNGLNRKPLYIECNESGVLFFPDKTLIPSNDESDNLKNEILNRTSLLREYLQQTLGPKESTPYLMLLVRPGGITNYWKLQSIIKPMDIDFGYELVDKIWVLDIPTEQSAPAPSKLVSMIKPMQIPKPIPAPGNILGGINSGNGNIPQKNNDSIKNGAYQNGNEKRNGSTGNARSISYGATAQNIRPITALPGFPANKNSTNTLVKNNPTLINNQNANGAGNNNANGAGNNNANDAGNNNANGASNNNANGASNNNANGASNNNANGASNNNANGAGNSNANSVGFGITNQNGNGPGNNSPNSVGFGNSNQNGNGPGNKSPNSVGLGNSNQNGNGPGNNSPNSLGFGNSNQNSNGNENINPNNPGLGNSNQNNNGAANPNNLRAGNSNQNSNGVGINNPNMNNNSNGKNETQTNKNQQTNGNPNKYTTDINQNDQAGINNGNTKAINKGSDSSGSGNPSNSANNGAEGVPGSKGSYSVATTPNSLADGNSNNQKGTGNSSSGEDKNKSNTNNSDGSPSQKGDEPNSTSRKESTKSSIGSNGQDLQPTSQDQNPSISISLNSNKNEPNVTNQQSAPRTTYNREDESQSNSDAKDPTARIAAPLPELGPRKSSTPAPLRAARLFADRDWVIYVECKFEEILVHPNRLVIPTNLLASEEGVKRFVQEIEKMITRKQSTVRAGEPPYRPEVRFLVWPDGLRPYHLSYPALQSAGIKQKRQNLESEDSIKDIIQGR